MTKLPGLARFDDDALRSRSGGKAPQGRAIPNTQLRQAPSLRPQAAPVNTYARPAQAPIDNNLRNLAESLASLNPSLMRFAETRKETMDETLSARVAQKYAGKTYEEQRTLYKDDPDAQSLLGRRAIAANMGRAYAQQVGRTAADYYESQFDKDGGDLDGYLNGLQRQAIDANPDDPFFAEQFSQVFDPIAQSIRNKHTQYGVERTQEKVAETVHNSWLGTVNASIVQDVPAADIAENIRSSYEVNKEGLKMSYADQDKQVVGLIQQLTLQMDQEPGQAEKLYGVIQALSVNPRTAADGTKLGRLLDSGSLGPDVAKLLYGAEQKVTAQRELTNYKTVDGFFMQAENGNLDADALDTFFNDPKTKGVITLDRRRQLLGQDRAAKEQAANNLIKEGRKAEVRAAKEEIFTDALASADDGTYGLLSDSTYVNENGEEANITREQKDAEVVRRILAREDRIKQSDPRDPAVVGGESFNRQVRIFSQTGLKNPEWEGVLATGVSAMTSAQEETGIKDETRTGFAIYRQLNAKTPNYLRTLLSSDQANVYETARILTETGTLSADEALVATQRFYSDPTRANSATDNMTAKQIKEAVQSTNGYWTKWSNPQVLYEDTQKLAVALVGAGKMDPKKAVQQAAATVAKGYTVVNGHAVKTADQNVPQNFGDLANRWVREWHGRFGAANGLDADEVTIQAVPGSSGIWRAVSKETGLPIIMEDDPRGGIFSQGDMQDLIQKDREDAAAKAAKENRERNDPLFKLGPLTIGKPRWGFSDADMDDLRKKSAASPDTKINDFSVFGNNR